MSAKAIISGALHAKLFAMNGYTKLPHALEKTDEVVEEVLSALALANAVRRRLSPSHRPGETNVSKIVETMARAICESVGPEGSADAKSQMGDWPAWHDWLPQARAALRAVKPSDIPDDMLEAFEAEFNKPLTGMHVNTDKGLRASKLVRAIAASMNAAAIAAGA